MAISKQKCEMSILQVLKIVKTRILLMCSEVFHESVVKLNLEQQSQPLQLIKSEKVVLISSVVVQMKQSNLSRKS